MLVGTTRGANEIHTKSGVVDVLITRDNNELISDIIEDDEQNFWMPATTTESTGTIQGRKNGACSATRRETRTVCAAIKSPGCSKTAKEMSGYTQKAKEYAVTTMRPKGSHRTQPKTDYLTMS